MKDLIIWIMQVVTDAAKEPKVAGSVTGGTTISAAITAANLIPAIIGWSVTILGAIGTIVVIYVNITSELRKREKHKLEIELLNKQLND